MNGTDRENQKLRISSFRDSWRNWTRITSIRIIAQAAMFALFLSFVLLTTFANLDRYPGLRYWLSKFLEIDPLIALATAITTHTVYKGLLWSLIILIPTLFLGRFFCNWICPYGSLHQFVGWLFRSSRSAGPFGCAQGRPPSPARPVGRPQNGGHGGPTLQGLAEGARKDSRTSGRDDSRTSGSGARRDSRTSGTSGEVREGILAPAIEANRYRRSQRVKYYILVAVLVAAAFGTLQIGLLDPICLLYRSLTGAVVPALSMPAPGLFGDYRLHQGAWLIGFLLFGLVAMNLVVPRFFCRVLCPLGALLGVLSWFAWWRIQRDPDRCQGCERCRAHCEAACDPHARLRKAECFVCFNCIEDCPQGALRFAAFPPKTHEVSGPDLSRRKVVFAAVTGLLFYPFARTSGRTTRDFSSLALRPPGAVEELEFLERCVRCDQCIRVCPTNVIQPAWFESGLEGLWSPIMNFRMGHCQLHCTACGQVCPTGAIQRIPVAQKLGLGTFADAGPIKLGTAHIDPGRCLPHSKNIPCVVCEEVCPTSPKAIYGERVIRTLPDGERIELKVPRVDTALCIGCGICERECPIVGDRRAVYVTAEGETRSQHYPQRDRNRSIRLMKTAPPAGGDAPRGP